MRILILRSMESDVEVMYKTLILGRMEQVSIRDV